jgi:LacI family transcriptional regulator
MTFPCCQDRYRGYLDGLTEAGMVPDPELTVAGGFHPPTIRERVSELLARPERPTAIVAQNDNTAYAVMQAAVDCGLRVPQDLSVIGFDDIASSADTHPPLTTVRQPFPEMGMAAAKMLLEAIDAGEPGGSADGSRRQATMPTSLISRESTAPAPEKPYRPARTPAPGPDSPPRLWSGLGPNISRHE